ncbi:hypothetical protein AMAG_07836 [Allomyces macrogynus ATCC 38327]|uniref:Uncharacterized protein n=1 Tax=Allomyces macrogynus (strain ATCC 38327) TaxID=578462 RepID=A0A0L0SJN3_ALLM3|nr:hypothetical protein AMAG_07836 [Allomyces macrogynus ATCC 38327]|eukprot:KNE62639.1 hypothetical protein AMAG_07836 [Allomyces macrogynus ATCC 38327]
MPCGLKSTTTCCGRVPTYLPAPRAERRCRYVHAVDIDAKRVPPVPQAAAAGPTWHYEIAAPRTSAGPAGWLTAPIHAAGNMLRALFGVAQKSEEVVGAGAVKIKEKVKDAGVAVADGAAETAERVARVAGRAAHGAGRVVHGVEDSAARAAHQVQDAASRAAHDVQDAVHGAQDAANRVVQRAKTKAGQVAHGARDAAVHAVHHVRDSAAHAAHHVRESAAHAVHNAVESAAAVAHGAHEAAIRAEAEIEHLGHAAAGTAKHAAHQVQDTASMVAQTAQHAAQSAAHELASTVHRLRDLVAALPNPVAPRSGYDYGEYEIADKRKPRDRDHRRAAAKELKDDETRQQSGTVQDAPLRSLADKFRSQRSAVDRDLHHASHEVHAIADSIEEIEHLLARAAHGVAALGDLALGPDGIGHRRVAESTDHRAAVPAVPMAPPVPPASAAAIAPQQQPHTFHPRPEVMSAVAPLATAPWTVPFVPFPITAACAVLLALGYAAASRALARNRERLRVWHGDGLRELDKYIMTSALAMERDRVMGQPGIVNEEVTGRTARARYTVVPANLKALLGSALAVKNMNASAPVPLVLLALVEISGLTQWTILLAIALTMAQYLQYAGIDDDVHRLCEDRIVMHGRPPVLAKPPARAMEDGETVHIEHHPPPPEELAEPFVLGEPRPIGAQLFGQIKDGVVHEVEEIVHGVERALPARVRSWHPTTSGVGSAINWGVQAVELGLLGLRVSGMAQ